jgi:DNA-binding transcriptional ArsR family regulator
MTINFHIPPQIVRALARSGRDPAAEFTEAALVEFYRLGWISHGELAEALGMSRSQADAVLRRHQVTEDLLSSEELSTQTERLRQLAG